MEWKIREEHRREDSGPWFSRWLPVTPLIVVQDWKYCKPPLDNLSKLLAALYYEMTIY